MRISDWSSDVCSSDLQSHILDGCRIDGLAVDLPTAARQLIVLKDRLDGVQIKLGGHIEHGVVLIIEPAMGFGVVVVSFEQIHEIGRAASGESVCQYV